MTTTQYVYPAVKFKLERYYYSNGSYNEDGSLKEDAKPIQDKTFKQEKIWTGREVTAAHNEQNPKTGYVDGTITFNNLEKYAPNGSEFQYTVIEDDSYLSGYDTWAAKGDLNKDAVKTTENSKVVSVKGLTVTVGSATTADTTLKPQATFVNEFKTTPDKEKYPMIIQKVWRDYDNAFNLRPETIKVDIYRDAATQSGQGNWIREYFATVTLPTSKDKGTFNIEYSSHIPEADRTIIQFDATNGIRQYDRVWINGENRNEPGWQWKLDGFERRCV